MECLPVIRISRIIWFDRNAIVGIEERKYGLSLDDDLPEGKNNNGLAPQDY